MIEFKLMRIRQATVKDIDRLVEIDREAYGETGGSKDYFAKKLKSFPQGVLVVEDKGKVTGVIIFEVMDKKDVLEDFRDMRLTEPIKGRWMYTVVFTTATNYKDINSDSKLLLAAEEIAKNLGCVEAGVPLSKEHPFAENGVFRFWELNGYRRVGEIKWLVTEKQFIDCYFYKKSLN